MTNAEELLKAAETFENFCNERHCGDCPLYYECGEWTDTTLPRMMSYFMDVLKEEIKNDRRSD